MTQKELKDLKRYLLQAYDSIVITSHDPSRPKPDEDAEIVLGHLHTTIAAVVNRIEVKYKK